MKMCDKIDIAAPADAVWPYVADPAKHPAWNRQIVSVDRQRQGPATHGERFDLVIRYGGDEHLSHSDVIACEAGRLITFRHRATVVKSRHSKPSKKEWTLTETFAIEPRDDGVRLRRTIDLAQAGVPWWAWGLLVFIRTFGTSADEPQLDRLKRLVEAEVSSDAMSSPAT